MSDKRNVPEAHAHVSKETLRTKELLDKWAKSIGYLSWKRFIKFNPEIDMMTNETREKIAQFIRDETKKEIMGVNAQTTYFKQYIERAKQEASTQTANEIFDYQMKRLNAVRKHLKTLPTLSQDELIELKGKKMTIWFKGMEILLSMELLPAMKKKYGVK
jgi:predicted patatin/cPLA2 family phospholipase